MPTAGPDHSAVRMEPTTLTAVTTAGSVPTVAPTAAADSSAATTEPTTPTVARTVGPVLTVAPTASLTTQTAHFRLRRRFRLSSQFQTSRKLFQFNPQWESLRSLKKSSLSQLKKTFRKSKKTFRKSSCPFKHRPHFHPSFPSPTSPKSFPSSPSLPQHQRRSPRRRSNRESPPRLNRRTNICHRWMPAVISRLIGSSGRWAGEQLLINFWLMNKTSNLPPFTAKIRQALRKPHHRQHA